MSQAERASETGFADDPAPFSATPRKASCGRCGCMVALLVITLAIIGVIGLRSYLISQLGPARIARLKSYDTEIVSVPQEWQTPAPLPSDEVVQFQINFYDTMAGISKRFSGVFANSRTTQSLYRKMHNGGAVTPYERQQIGQLIETLTPIIAETSSALQLPNYTAEMFMYTTGTSFLQVQNFTKLSSMVALETARRGDCERAMEIAVLPIRYLRHEKPTSLIFELIRVACTRLAVDTVNELAETCNDVAALQHGLDLLNQLRDTAKPLSREEILVTDSIGLANRARAFGYPANLSPQTWSQMTQQVQEILERPYNEWAVKHFLPDDPRHQTAQGVLDTIKEQEKLRSDDLGDGFSITGIFASFGIGTNLLGFSPAAILADIAVPNYDEALTRSRAMFAYYDLARLHLAQRLVELRGAADGGSGADAVTAYIQIFPPDPFSSGTLLFQREANHFYSVGPDQDDDGGTMIYDASNGTFSDGDVVRREW